LLPPTAAVSPLPPIMNSSQRQHHRWRGGEIARTFPPFHRTANSHVFTRYIQTKKDKNQKQEQATSDKRQEFAPICVIWTELARGKKHQKAGSRHLLPECGSVACEGNTGEDGTRKEQEFAIAEEKP